MKLKKGITLLSEKEGSGELVQRQQHYVLAIRLQLNHGEVIQTPNRCLSHSVDERNQVNDEGYFNHRVRINRETLIAGIFYTVDTMRVGGYRKVTISPHLAYGEQGIPGIIPPQAVITAEIHVIERG